MTPLQEILIYVAPMVITIAGTLFWQRFRKIEKRVDNFNKEFDLTRQMIGCTEKKIIAEISDLRVHLAESYVNKEDCIHRKQQMS
jgi:hypothetical protein